MGKNEDECFGGSVSFERKQGIAFMNLPLMKAIELWISYEFLSRLKQSSYGQRK